MIVTLTANPSVDRTVTLAGPLVRGAVQRALDVVDEPGGKGVNVARAVTAAGRVAVAVLPGALDDPLVVALREAHLVHRAVPVLGATRVNLTIAELDGTTTKVNAPGTPLPAAVLDALAQALLREAAGARWAAISGSLPPGVPTGWYAELVTALRGTGARVAVDTSGPPLAAVVTAGVLPDLIKPNAEELVELLVGIGIGIGIGAGAPGGAGEAREAPTTSDVAAAAAALEAEPQLAAEAAASLVQRGVGAVLVTLGGAGAVLATAEGAWAATSAPVVARSTVGAGDCTLAGYLLADLAGEPAEQRLRLAVATGAAAVTLPGSAVPGPDDVHPDLVTTRALGVLAAP